MLRYGRNLTRDAVDQLATHPGGIADRLAAAFNALHPVLAQHWEAPMAEQVTRVGKGFEVALELGDGDIKRGCRRMHHSKRRALAVAVIDLFESFGVAMNENPGALTT